MPKITVLPDARDIPCGNSKTLLQALLQAGVPHIYVCGGQTRCTTCRVLVLEGLEHCMPRNAKERTIAERLHFGPAVRLACQTQVNGDVKIRRLVLDDVDVAMASLQVVERVRAEVLAMRGTEDMVRIAGVLWEGLHDVGLPADYCSIDVIDQEHDTYRIYAAATVWLQKQYGKAPTCHDLLPGVNCYQTELPLSEVSDEERAAELLSSQSTEAERRVYQAFMAKCWQTGEQQGDKPPRCWVVVPFSHGRINMLSVKPARFHDNDVQVLKSFADAVSLAYARFLDFRNLEQRNKELRDAYRELKETQTELVQAEKMASLGRLAAGVAHEINTPLGALKSNLDVIRISLEKLKKICSRTGKARTHQFDDVVSTAERLHQVNSKAIERIEKIVKSLKGFSWLDRAEIQLIDIHEGLEDTLALVQHRLREGIRVHKAFGRLPRIKSNASQLNQVFMNLIVNAIDAIDGPGDIFIRTFAQNKQVVVEIQDTGAGIPEEHLQKIFEPGFTTKGVRVGTGLGLAIVYKIMEALSGRVEVESRPGQGATFRIILPLEPPK